ncbi:phage major capsid family protein [Paraburkholderia flagellata]|uniref:phage major capsid family protein n=1 Tax=Paraburkholderia flagellata TaxID=2883241 RepID=UPI001F338F59|nr:phage major capsid protein [Paraburkholderia flagellata]
MATRFGFAQVARALAIGRGDLTAARAYLAARHGPHSEPAEFINRAIADTAVIDNPQGMALSGLGADFIGLVARRSITGQIAAATGFHRVLPGGAMLVHVVGAAAAWVPEAAVIPVGDEGFAIERMLPCKLAVIVVVTDELLRAIGEASDAVLNRDLTNACADALTAQFASADPGVEGSKPPGIFYGIDPIPSTGDAKGDVAALLEGFGGDLSTSCFIMQPVTAAALALGNISDTLGAQGGFLAGIACATSEGVPAGVVGLVDSARVAMLDLGVGLDLSRQALVEVDDGSGATKLVSLWQDNLNGLRAINYANWKVLDASAVRWIDGFTTPPAMHA